MYQSGAKHAGPPPAGVESDRPENARVDAVSWLVQQVTRHPASAMDAAVSWMEDFVSGVFAGPSLARRNRQLEDALRLYRSQNTSATLLQGAVDEARQLAGLPKYPTFKNVSANIIGYFPDTRRLMLSVGSSRMVRPGAPVTSANGLVGQVVEVSSNTCYVNLLTHADFSVGARVVRRTAQEAGIAVGQAAPHLLLSVYNEGALVEVGDVVTTSGLSTIYPEGIEIGRVTEVWTNRSLGLREASVVPTVDPGGLRHVVVLVR